MILRTTSPAPVADLLKALAAHAEAAPAAAPAAAAAAPSSSHGAPQPGAEGRKVGGKYVKRWWENGRWNYDYGDGGAKHHPASFGHHEDSKREHHHPLPEGHQPHPKGAEADYHQAHARAFAPGAVHQVPHPSKEKAGEHLAVSSLPSGKVEVREGNGRSRPFNSHADYEKWHRGVQAGARTVHDAQGNVFAHIAPKVGTVKNGMLEPREESDSPGAKKKAWVIKYPDGKEGYAVSKEAAEKQVAQQFTHMQRFAGDKEEQVADPRAEGHREMQGLDEVESRLKWRLGGAQDPYRKNKPVLAVSPEEREQIIQQIAHVYTPFLVKRAQQVVDGYAKKIGALSDPAVRSNAIQELIGFDPGSGGARGATAVVAQPGSRLHQDIGNALHLYNPNTVDKNGQRVGLKGYLTGTNGPMVNALKRDMVARIIPQHLGTANTSAATNAAVDAAPSQAPAPDEALEQNQQPYTDEATTTDPNVWKQRQSANFTALAQAHPHVPSSLIDQAQQYIAGAKTSDDIGQRIGAFNGLDQKFPLGGGKRWSDYIADFGKSLQFAAAIIAEEMAKSAGGFVMRDKGVDPTHTYSHREGTEDHPRYYFRSQNGDYVRYTNAPGGHADASKFNGDPAVHFAEPSSAKAPQFFSPDGRKLTRAPAQGIDIQWNRNYHPQDSENLWYGRWVEPSTGEHAYTYLDADIRGIPELLIHQQNALTDVRVPVLRSYVARLSTSPHLKDRVTALGLALVDQGRMRLQELGALKVADVYEQDSLWCLGSRYIYADRKTRSLLTLLTKDRHPEEPFLAVPQVKMDGDFDTEKIRIVGPHYLEGILEQIGLSAAALQVYHATQTFSREVQRILYEGCAPWESACAYATAQVAAEMGYDLSGENDLERALPLIRELLIDPVVVEVLERNANQNKLCDGDPRLLSLPARPVSYVSLDLNTRTADEQDFSAWLHAYPVHQHARVALQQAQAQPDAPSVQM